MWLSSPYKGHDDLNVPVPIVNIERESFYVRGTDAGAFLWKNESQAFSLGISYSELFFDAGKTKNHNLKKLDNRHSTLNAFLQYTLYSPYGHASIQLLRAPLITPTLSAAWYQYPLSLDPVHFTPRVGNRWDSQQQLDYYYGISGREAQESGLGRYRPQGGVSPFISLDTRWPFADDWSVITSSGIIFLNKEIRNNPIVDDNLIFHVTIGLSYSF
ncbi:MipA/OmpV family protein [Citrobacter farmeri]|uniref:MipA/OmpV family protein n=1 Tax=Citrobacter farmeri TaxID=67824 RepID=UPI0018FF4E99|nr:MipA/OmpV family protein [Citrobacter farmeri]MBJ9133333.1 MipA/OmpV family protein [Citrobacter farmeri]